MALSWLPWMYRDRRVLSPLYQMSTLTRPLWRSWASYRQCSKKGGADGRKCLGEKGWGPCLYVCMSHWLQYCRESVMVPVP